MQEELISVEKLFLFFQFESLYKKQLFYFQKKYSKPLILCIFYICILDYYTFPSGDEIGTADSAINWVTNGEWYSAVWVYTYHPLHNFSVRYQIQTYLSC